MNKEFKDYKLPIHCIQCKKKIEINDWYVHQAIIGKLEANFGSENDGTIYQIGICDKCVEKLKLVPIGNYLFPYDAEWKKKRKNR